MANREMVELWNGPTSDAWVLTPERYDAMLGGLGLLALDAAALRPGERVLDIGCGSGDLSRSAAERVRPGGSVLGLDVSAPLVELAAHRAADDLAFLVGDAQVHDLGTARFDVLVSRFGVMFFDDPVAAFTQLRSAMAPGGRLSFVAWQAAPLNEWVLTAIGALVPHVGFPQLPPPGAPGPFAFAEADHVRAVLASAGWTDVEVRAVSQPLLVGGPGSVDDVVAFYEQDAFGRMMLAQASPEAQVAGRAALREAVAERIGADGLEVGAAVWVVTART